ncbi:hypothetical protein HDU96_005553 [Phlyctochytrium bullatum]|nr:hypothetical protein HDU96_005553 [Phlyctochytrium bullatum]
MSADSVETAGPTATAPPPETAAASQTGVPAAAMALVGMGEGSYGGGAGQAGQDGGGAYQQQYSRSATEEKGGSNETSGSAMQIDSNRPTSSLEMLAHSIPPSPPRHPYQPPPAQDNRPYQSVLEGKRQRDEEPGSIDPTPAAGETASSTGPGSGGSMDDDDALQSYRKRKRLSINTTLSETGLPRYAMAAGANPPPSNASSGPSTGNGVGYTPSATPTPVSRDVYEKTLMVKQQQKALIEARNLKVIKNTLSAGAGSSPGPLPSASAAASQYVPVVPPNVNGAGEGLPAVAPSSAEPTSASATPSSKSIPIPVRRNSLRNLKIMTPSAGSDSQHHLPGPTPTHAQQHTAPPQHSYQQQQQHHGYHAQQHHPHHAGAAAHHASASHHGGAAQHHHMPPPLRTAGTEGIPPGPSTATGSATSLNGFGGTAASSTHSTHPSNTSSAMPSPRLPPPSSQNPTATGSSTTATAAAATTTTTSSTTTTPSSKPIAAARYTSVLPSSAVASPRSEFPSRDLPLPTAGGYDTSGAPPRSPHPLFADRDRAKQLATQQPPPKSPSSAYPVSAHPNAAGAGAALPVLGGVPRSSFLGAFETLYDAAEEVPRLATTLREQVRRSSSLLQTLQASGAMIEGLVRGLFREMQAQYGEKFGAALADLNRRLCVVEEANGIVNGGGMEGAPPATAVPQGAGTGAVLAHHGFRGLGPPTPYVGVGGSSALKGFASNDIILKSLMERIEALEKKTEP